MKHARAVIIALVLVGTVVALSSWLVTRSAQHMAVSGEVALLPATETPEWVNARVRTWLPTDHERMWEKIAWTVGIRNALNRAQALNRPVMLFSYAGCVEGRL